MLAVLLDKESKFKEVGQLIVCLFFFRLFAGYLMFGGAMFPLLSTEFLSLVQ